MRRPPLLQQTPAARIAAVATNLAADTLETQIYPPDFADLRDALAPFMAREILIARIGEAKTCGRPDRVADLELQLAQIVLKPFSWGAPPARPSPGTGNGRFGPAPAPSNVVTPGALGLSRDGLEKRRVVT